MVGGAVLFVVVSLRGIAGFYTDYLWYEEVGFTDVWSGLLVAKALPAVVFTSVFFVLTLANLIIADRLAPKFRPTGPEDELVERYRQVVGPYAGRVRVAVAAFLALVAGGGLTTRWEEWVLFRNRGDFGTSDAQFGTDIGFFVFTLPFLRFIFEWTFAALVIVLLVTAVAHYLNGGIRPQGALQRVTPQVKAHLSVVIGVMALLKALGYWLERFALDFSTRGYVTGAGYTDVKAELPALNLLIIISVAAAILFLVNIRLRGWVLPVIAVGLWSFVSVAVGGIYPAAIQRFSVEPNEFQKESEYIERNIAATRAAFGLDKVQSRAFDYSEGLDADDIEANEATIGDARLWDPDVLRQTYSEIQKFRDHYQFGDVDIDRYKIDGVTRQVVLAVRELNQEQLPSRTWQNEHLVFTHGYGLAASASNGVAPDGRPTFLVKDMPPVSEEIELTQPAIYYGEEASGYAFVNTKVPEYDFPREPDDATASYKGEGGVEIGSFFRRAALALRFGDFKLLISDQVTPQSKALYLRNIRERVEKAAPFLHFDADPYPVVLDGRVLWVIDAYTTTSWYPYSQLYATDSQRLPGSGLRGTFNYIRNSVKATVDAYDGTVRFYAVDDEDPLVGAYRNAFPSLFHDREDMPAGLEAHLRYPEDLFRVQADHYGRYHVTAADTFFRGAREWAVAQDPESGRLNFGGTAQTTAPPATAPPGPRPVARAAEDRMEPYYLLMRLPGQEEENFLILQPFVPTARGEAEPKNLVSFMVAKSDPGEYGKLEAYTMPLDEVVLGPAQVDSVTQSTPDISRALTPLNQSGSQVHQGSLLLIPVEESILYIRPLYLQAEGSTALPELEYVIVSYGGKAVLGRTLDEALGQIFPGYAGSDPGRGPAPETGKPPPPTPGAGGDVGATLAQAADVYAEAQAALRAGDLAGYQAAVDRLGELIAEAEGVSGGRPAPADGVTTTSTTATTTTSGDGS